MGRKKGKKKMHVSQSSNDSRSRGRSGRDRDKSSRDSSSTRRDKHSDKVASVGAPKKGKPNFFQRWKRYILASSTTVEVNEDAAETCRQLRLTQKHLRALRKRFSLMDDDESGEVDYEEFMEALGEERTPFTDALFIEIDADGSGEIDFNEFVQVCGSYCVLSQDDILRFAFNIFDADGSGSIDEEEFDELAKSVNN